MLSPSLWALEMRARSFGGMGDSRYRCQRCGGGPIEQRGGDLGSYCLNCSNYRVSEPFFDISLAEALRRAGRWFKGISARRKERRLQRREKDLLFINTEGLLG